MDKDGLITSAQESKGRAEAECDSVQTKIQGLQKELARVLQQKSQEEGVTREYEEYQQQQ